MKKKVILGLSGGVDSAVSLIRLIEEGYDVEACFMRNWDSALNNDVLGNPNDINDICPQEKDYMDALDVANKLGVKMHRIDFVQEYWDYVFQYFLDEYKKGRTPNPDIMCNKEIKFKAFLDYANNLGCDYIAMGHYARVIHTENESYLLRGIDENKDQTYFLCQLNQNQLKKALFPIGDMIKPDVRKKALECGLSVAKKKDSTGICFIGERNFSKFLSNYLPSKKGKMVMLDGTIIGEHDGLMYYTIGQRKGLKIGGLDGYDKDAWFVLGKDIEKNELIVGQGFSNPYLYSNKCTLENVNWIPLKRFEGIKKCSAKFRYRSKDEDVCLEWIGENEMIVTYDNVRAVTPGQSCVFYDGEYCLGGGIINKVYMNDDLRKY